MILAKNLGRSLYNYLMKMFQDRFRVYLHSNELLLEELLSNRTRIQMALVGEMDAKAVMTAGE